MDSLIKIKWDNIAELSSEEISYYLYLEGKSAEAVSVIRNITLETAKTHIINGKIKYGIIAKCKDISQLFNMFLTASKADKTGVVEYLDSNLKEELAKYIAVRYADMLPKEKETAVWCLGELKSKSGYNVLVRASVHKFINIRRLAVSAMGKINDMYFEDALINSLEDINPQVVLYSIKALSRLSSKKAYEKIINIHKNAEKEYLREAAEKWLEIQSA